jgi:hypothetical protein
MEGEEIAQREEKRRKTAHGRTRNSTEEEKRLPANCANQLE